VLVSPLEIIALLNLHARAEPFADMPWRQAGAPAMRDAYRRFESHGLLAEGVNFDSVYFGRAPHPFLSGKGLDVVRRLCEVQL
jgi:hypothetical protein